MLKLHFLPVILAASIALAPGAVAAGTPPPAQASAPVALASITGSVTDAQGGPVSGAQLLMVGATAYEARSDAKGLFTIAGVKPGIYSLAVTKPGYNATTQEEFVVAAGQSQQLSIVLQQRTLTSLREIGSVTVLRRGTFNTTAASVQNITAQAFANQAQPQVQRVLDQTPGVVVDHPGTSATNAAPGAITFPSIRGGLGFETASLIDGHPLAVGLFGDYVTTFLNSYVLSNTELIKGPGASSPSVNYAIGGTINFRTKDPTTKPAGELALGVDSFGGQFSNMAYSGTTTNGRFGWILDYAVDGAPGPLQNSTLGAFNLPGGSSINGGKPITSPINAIPTSATNGIQNNPKFYSSTLEALGFPVAQTYVNKTELIKFRYKLSDATGIVLSYLGSQTWTDQNGNHVNGYNQLFTPCGKGAVAPCPAYSGAMKNGSSVFTWQNVFVPFGEWEVNNEPIFQGEIHSTLGKDTVLLRGYTASINRLQFSAVDSPLQPFSQTFNLYGTDSNKATYNGDPASVAFATGSYQCLANGNLPLNFATNGYVSNPAGAANATCYYSAAGKPLPTAVGSAKTASTAIISSGTPYFRSAEEDRISGLSFEYDHLLKGDAGNTISLAYDTSAFRTHAYAYRNQNFPDSVPDGSRQRFGTILLRGVFNVTPKWRATLSNYFNTYYQRASNDGGLTFQDFNSSHFDPRIGLEYRANHNISYRFAAGSAIAPPYLGLINDVAGARKLDISGLFATQAGDNPQLRPETSFGYDFGGDFRFGRDLASTATFDVYSTTLWNQFIKSSVVTCNVDPLTLLCLPPGTGTIPLVTTQNMNLGQAKYQGIEVGLRRDPVVGWGGLIQGALLRAYPTNLPPCFYSSNPATKCGSFDTNLGVIPGANFYGSGTGGGSVTPASFNAVNNHAIPYAQGYAEVHYNWANGMYASIGEQLYGNNNSLNVPAFVVMNATFRMPIGGGATLQLSGDNLNNAYPNAYLTAFGGIGVPLANGKLGLTNANVIGPRNIKLVLSKKFGAPPPKL